MDGGLSCGTLIVLSLDMYAVQILISCLIMSPHGPAVPAGVVHGGGCLITALHCALASAADRHCLIKRHTDFKNLPFPQASTIF